MLEDDEQTQPKEYIGDVSSEVEREIVPKRTFAQRLSSTSKGLAPHIIVEARAGTGKTTTLIEGLKFIKGLPVSIEPSHQQAAVWEQLAMSGSPQSACFVAFSKSIATELQNRVPPGYDAMTMHSMGYKPVRYAFNIKRRPNRYRVRDIISEIDGRDIREICKHDFEMLKATEKLVSLCKMNLVGCDTKDHPGDCYDSRGFNEALSDLASHYDVELNGNSAKIFVLVPKVLERCKDVNRDQCCDFDDMIWLPVVCDLNVRKYDMLLVDESQDLSRCQQQLALKVIGDRGRLVLCGDSKQAIYGFAGADARSMSRLQTLLEKTDRGCVHLPLTVTRRCGKEIVEEAKKIVLDFEAHKSCCDGKISKMSFNEELKNSYHNLADSGDMCLCRINAPLVSQCFKFLKEGRKAHIQGRDVGQGLINLINKLKATDLDDLSSKLSEWAFAERKKELAKRSPNESRLISIDDKAECIECFMEDQSSIEKVVDKIKDIFTNDQDSPGIKFSSVHKAKGLEADRVFLLRPEGAHIPHPMAKTKWAIEQEYNILYVAITRARKELVYVS